MSDSLPNASDPSRRHVAVYRRLLALFPSEFRHAYGGLMAQLFHDQCRDARRRANRTTLAMAALWGQTLLDTGKAAGREHLSNLRKWFRLQPKNSLQNSLMNAPVPSRYRAAKWLIPVGTIVGLAVAALIGWSKPNEYRSTSVLMVAPKISVGSSSGAENRAGLNTIESTVTMIQSDAVIQRALTKLQNDRVDPTKLVRPTLVAAPGAGGTFIMMVNSTNFEYSRQFATAWAQEFMQFNQERHRSLVNNAEAKLVEEILVFQKKLDHAQQARSDFQKRYAVIATGGGDSPLQRRLEETKAEFVTLQLELRETESTTAEQLAQTAPGNRWFDFRLEEKRAGLRLQGAPKDAALQAEFELRQDDLKALLAVTEEMRLAKIESLKRRLAGYPPRIDEFTAELFDGSRWRGELQRLDDEEKSLRQQLGDLNRSRLLLQTMDTDGEITILSAGGGDPRPVGPNRQLILLQGFTWGAIAGLVLALIRARSGGPKDPGTPSSTASLMPAPIGA